MKPRIAKLVVALPGAQSLKDNDSRRFASVASSLVTEKHESAFVRLAEPTQPKTEARDRDSLIRQAAYLRAERRGFVGGSPIADWLEAEKELAAFI
ncbi:MAG: DUF2934 domain-containing protein [Clostridia bacterium]|nr:DUF2934 domain-containing protein [Deltaproteobacteria bacterium]